MTSSQKVRSFMQSKRTLMQSGSTLVVVLLVLLLLSGLVVAFFVRATDDRKRSRLSTDQTLNDLLQRAAMRLVIWDLVDEIDSGTESHPVIQPSKNHTLSLPGLVKVSGNKLWTSGVDRNAGVSTTVDATNISGIPNAFWRKPQWVAPTDDITALVPYWIYLNRKGDTPTSLTGQDLANAADQAVGNAEAIIGRFAFVIYDEGGLLDINTVGGEKLAAGEQKGRLSQTSPVNGIDSMSDVEFDKFLKWRWPDWPHSIPLDLSDPKQSFVHPAHGERAFVNRQDLLRYSSLFPDQIPPESLPFLTTFSRDLNAPAPFEDKGVADVIHTTFTEETSLNRPEGTVTVPAGTSVMPRRFPLSKIGLLKEGILSSEEADAIRYYFGLERAPGSTYAWRYTDGIKSLETVRDEKREPNFFEVLKAAIVTEIRGETDGIKSKGSLGRSFGSAITDGDFNDQWTDLQIMQIGANIIDQWDKDDIPTTIQFDAAVAGMPELYGIENLPYIHQMASVGHFPSDHKNNFEVWQLFDVWNPHQNAETLPQGIEGFQIIPGDGEVTAKIKFRLETNGGKNVYAALADQTKMSSTQSPGSAGKGSVLGFPANVSYDQPTPLGNAQDPPLGSHASGILLVEMQGVPPAIPKQEDWLGKNADLESAIEEVVGDDQIHTWTGVKAHNSVDLTFKHVDFKLQARVNGQWRTYQWIEDINGKAEAIVAEREEDGEAKDVDTHYSGPNFVPDNPDTNGFYLWRLSPPPGRSAIRGTMNDNFKFDPRTTRFGFSGTSYDMLGHTLRESPYPWSGVVDQSNTDWMITRIKLTPGIVPLIEGMEYYGIGPSEGYILSYGMVTNDPDRLGVDAPLRYADNDGVIRPADGYFGALPTLPNNLKDRPIILNRPFQSIGELGYAFRDQPWKTLDFATKYSGDLALSEFFSLQESTEATPLVGGKVNLNTPHPEVLTAILTDALMAPNLYPGGIPSTLTKEKAKLLAQEIVDATQNTPLTNRGDLVKVLFEASNVSGTTKTERESAFRALAEVGSTRVWNLMVDLVCQTGKIVPKASDAGNFVVHGEQRYWIHLAIDRVTGKVLDMEKEVVSE